MSEKGKKPGARDISDLKARLGLKRGGDAKTPGGPVPPPSAGKGTGYVPPPPGVAPQQPVVPDARQDPFGAMNAMAAQGAVTRAPEVIVVDKSAVEQVHGQPRLAKYGKIALLVGAPLILGFVLGGINHQRSRYNATVDDAKEVADEFSDLGKRLEALNNVLLRAKERGQGGKGYALADAELVADIEGLKFSFPDNDELILSHRNLYLLEPKLVQDTLGFYTRMRTLAQRLKEHVRLTKDLTKKMTPAVAEKIGAQAGFAGTIRVPSAEDAKKGALPSVEVLEIGMPVCSDGKPAKECAGGPPVGVQVRGDTQAPWVQKSIATGAADANDKVFPIRPNGIFNALAEGSPRFLDELQYYQRLADIDVLVSGSGGDGGLMKDRKDVEDRLKAVAQRGKAFAL
jgi:hypothetical protein